jgi:hypothetical protein
VLAGGDSKRVRRLAQAVAATVPLGRLVFPVKAVERSDWCSGPRGAVAIARPSPYGTNIRANDAKATAISGQRKPVAPLVLLG